MKGAEPAPSGDIASWFRFYKWDVEGEVYVPMKADGGPVPEVADFLWFALDDELIGGVRLQRVFTDPLRSGALELWYEPLQALEPTGRVLLSETISDRWVFPISRLPATLQTCELPDRFGEHLVSTCAPRVRPTLPPSPSVGAI
jgi:hypothetical protein